MKKNDATESVEPLSKEEFDLIFDKTVTKLSKALTDIDECVALTAALYIINKLLNEVPDPARNKMTQYIVARIISDI